MATWKCILHISGFDINQLFEPKSVPYRTPPPNPEGRLFDLLPKNVVGVEEGDDFLLNSRGFSPPYEDRIHKTWEQVLADVKHRLKV